MKRLIPVILALALLLAACAGDPAPASSTAASSTPASAADLSSQDVSSAESLPEYDERGWVIVENVRLNRRLSSMDEHSDCFYEGAPGYIVEGSSRPYRLDAETLRRVVATPCEGSGSLVWRDYTQFGANNPDQFDGVIPISKLNDPIFLSMNMPAEATVFIASRINPQNLASYPENANRILSIGAIYGEKNTEIADDETFTVCLGRMDLALKTVDQDWYLADSHPWPTAPNRLYYLPWELEKTVKPLTLPASRIQEMEDHVEVTLTGYDLNAVDKRTKGAVAACLHFWGGSVNIGSGSNVKGLVACYTVWVKEPEAVGKLVATIGADWYSAKGDIMQAFTGMNTLVKNEPRFVLGHAVGPKAYDEVMDSEKVQQLLGVK